MKEKHKDRKPPARHVKLHKADKKPKVREEAGARLLEPDVSIRGKQVAREDVLATLKAAAAGFEKVEGMLGLPERLYVRDYDFSTAYSEREDADSLSVESGLRLFGSELPDASKAAFTVALVSDSSDPKTSFFICDPKRRIIVSESLLYMGKGSWDEVADTLGRVLDKKKELDAKKEKYNFVVGYDGSVSVR